MDQPQSEAEEASWYDNLEVGAFADAYYGINYNFPKPNDDANSFRSFDADNGFAVSWAGFDVAYAADSVGGTVSLRFGPTAQSYAGADGARGLENLKQAYATWMPMGAEGAVSLDFGKFDTIYGAEVAESQLNFNYTRGLLNVWGQPFFHTGLRAGIELTEHLGLTAILVNGWDNSVDVNSYPAPGIQLNYSRPAADGDRELAGMHLGYMVGSEQSDVDYEQCTFDSTTFECTPSTDPSVQTPVGIDSVNDSGLRHLIDLVAAFNPTEELSLLLNGDVGFEQIRQAPQPGDTEARFDSQSWWGVSLMGRYQLDPVWAVAARGEVFGDPDGRTLGAVRVVDPANFSVAEVTLFSATLTVEAAPVSNLIVRLDNRLDGANEDVFSDRLRSLSSTQITSTLGVVVVTD